LVFSCDPQGREFSDLEYLSLRARSFERVPAVLPIGEDAITGLQRSIDYADEFADCGVCSSGPNGSKNL